ncbi:hypothetical protein [Novosphingobium sp. MMS21-SN21R]|uniref:hypothetical protein n=1 Tax=Novosphingobium sp. MMS21-SN21R TaxID=2969298 RepID=UPI0028861212|nr:hypothetical protein [Novosphingobium sp. MMS21-SN21R]MDT0507168.1 hypothetical protein [Novosphingobium sp. MMS21-SN21R]
MKSFNPPIREGQVATHGYAKVKLAHGRDLSLILVDRVFVEVAGAWTFFEPVMFGACRLAYLDNAAMVQVDVDTERAGKLFISFFDADLATRLPDGSHVYRCRIVAEAEFNQKGAGEARRRVDGGFDLRLFHHTAPATLPLIEASGHLRASAWNLQGNKALANVAYAYLTNRATITDDEDLAAIAMATDRRFGLLLDDRDPPDGVVIIEVTRSATIDRSATLALWVPDHIVASAHLLRHDQAAAIGIFYEVVLPAVFRVGLQPGAVLEFSSGVATPASAALRSFDYVIVGDAWTEAGIVAPYDEESTTSICKVQRVEDRGFAGFWRDHANTDRFTGLDVERQAFAGPA